MGLSLIGTPNLYSAENESVAVQQTVKKPSLEELARQGLPQEFREMGFTMGEYVNRDSDRELIIIGENHKAKDLKKKEREFINFLIEKYQADSLGLEGFWGALGKDDEKRKYSRELFSEKFLESMSQLLGNKIYLENDSFLEAEKNIYSVLADYIRRDNTDPQHSLRAYGLESRDVYAIAEIYTLLLNSLKLNLEKREWDKIKKIIPLVLEEAEKIGGKNKTLPETGVYLRNTPNEIFRIDYERVYHEILVKKRNEEFAKNIEKYMQMYDSKRSIIIVGITHAEYLRLSRNEKSIPELIPYSSLVICAPGVKIDSIWSKKEAKK